jgi:hypothetical protein
MLLRKISPPFAKPFLLFEALVLDIVKRFICARKTSNLLPSIPMQLITYRYVVVSLQIASGSDDLCAIIWDWEREKKLLSFKTGHTSNVFQVSACTEADPVRSGYSGCGAV